MKLPRLQFSLRSLLTVCLAVAVSLGWYQDELRDLVQRWTDPPAARAQPQPVADDATSRTKRRKMYLTEVKRLIKRSQELEERLDLGSSHGETMKRQAELIQRMKRLVGKIRDNGDLASPVTTAKDIGMPPLTLAEHRGCTSYTHRHVREAILVVRIANENLLTNRLLETRLAQLIATGELKKTENCLEESLRRLITCGLERCMLTVPERLQKMLRMQKSLYQKTLSLLATPGDSMSVKEWMTRTGRLSRDQRIIEIEGEKILRHLREDNSTTVSLVERVVEIKEDMRDLQILLADGEPDETTLVFMKELKLNLAELSLAFEPAAK